RSLFAALSLLPWPGTGYGDLWRAADLLREHRGDAHIAAWMGVVDACEITLLTELSWGLAPRSYVFTRGWKTETVDEAEARLQDRGLIRDGKLTAAGEDLRENIEARTDRSEAEVIERLGDRTDELFGLLRPRGRAIVEGGGYPFNFDNLTERVGGATPRR
ncbi:MAG: helix-turn-helix domain-containing protein, partial [Acidimicrobiia bacterium]